MNRVFAFMGGRKMTLAAAGVLLALAVAPFTKPSFVELMGAVAAMLGAAGLGIAVEDSFTKSRSNSENPH